MKDDEHMAVMFGMEEAFDNIELSYIQNYDYFVYTPITNYKILIPLLTKNGALKLERNINTLIKFMSKKKNQPFIESENLLTFQKNHILINELYESNLNLVI